MVGLTSNKSPVSCMSDTIIMQNLANSRPHLAAIFSSLDADTLSSPLLNLPNLDLIPHSSSNPLTNKQHHLQFIHSLGDTILRLDPASTAEPNFSTLPPILTTSRKNPAAICNSTNLNHNPSVAILSPVSNPASTTAIKGPDLHDELAFARACVLVFTANTDANSVRRTGSCASFSDFGLSDFGLGTSNTDANSVRRTGSCARLSDFGLGTSKGVRFKQSGKQRGEPRRKQLTRNFHTLRSLLPNVVPQVDRCTLIDKTCDYIKSLERQLQVLKRKGQILASIIESSFGDHRTDAQDTRVIVRDAKDKSIMPDSLLAPNEEEVCKAEAPHIQITISGNTININIGFYEKKRGIFPILLEILESKQLEILSANRSQQRQAVLYAIHVNAQQSKFPSKPELEALIADLYVQVADVILH